MIKNYINKIKANISIYASKKTSNILDGSYKSIYKGRSLNFEDLREYVIGDNIKDVDWKASARSGNLLVRQYIAEKKHNIMLVMDAGRKMKADTSDGIPKKEVTIMTAGTMAYLANKNGDYVGAVYDKEGLISYFPFREGLINIERILSSYDSDSEKIDNSSLEKSLDYINKFIKKRMIIFIITDLEGLENINENILKKLSLRHDVMIININDAYMTGNNAYDIENEMYIPKMFLEDKKLYELEKKAKEELYAKCEKKCKKYKISIATISNNQEITNKTIELLERHRNANIR